MKSITNRKNPYKDWSAFQPGPGHSWGIKEVGHLYRRVAFSGTWEEIRAGLREGPSKTLQKLLNPHGDLAAFNSKHDGFEKHSDNSNDANTLSAWWIYRILNTPHPLGENLTLFWRNYFAISHAKVKSSYLMRKHIKGLRTFALGDFRALVHHLFQEPAVFLQHNAQKNRKALPNEFFAEELLKGFGVLKYARSDIREIARAFTGWYVVRNELQFLQREHDSGTKRIFGKEGKWTGKDAINLILDQPGVADSMIRSLYNWLISHHEEPDAELLAPLVQSFKKDWNTGTLVRRMLESHLFYSSTAYRKRIKSPLEFAIGLVRPFEINVSPTRLSNGLIQLGQDLLSPPTTKGWPSGKDWMDNVALIKRHNLAYELLYDSDKFATTLTAQSLAKKYGFSSGDSKKQFYLDLLLQGDLNQKFKNKIMNEDIKGFILSLVMLPEFQMS